MGKIFNKYECSSNRKARRRLNKVIDDILKGHKPEGNQLIYAKSPKLFKEIGIPDYEIIMSPNEIVKAILSKNKATKLGYRTWKNDNYHNLGKKTFNKALNSIISPTFIIQENEKKIIIFSEYFDYKIRQIIIPMNIESISEYKLRRNLYHVVLSTHGRVSITNYINKLLNNKGKIIYKNNKKIQHLTNSGRVRYPDSISAVSINKIAYKNIKIKK